MMLHKFSKFSLVALLLSAPLLHAQTTAAAPVWSTIGSEGNIAITLPAGTTYRLGNAGANEWSASTTVTVATKFSPLCMCSGQFPFSDPAPDLVKELDVLETTSPQTVTVVDYNAGTTVSQIVPPIVPPAALPLQPGTAYTLTFSNFTTPASAGQNALMFAFVNAPANLANVTWEGTQMNLTVGGVTLVCSYGQTYNSGVFTLSCSVPPAATGTTTTTSGQ